MKSVLNIRKAIEGLFPGTASWKQLDKHSFYHRGLCFLCQRSGKKDVISFTKWKTVLCFRHKYSQTCLRWENLNLTRKQINKMSISASTNAFSDGWQPWDMLCLAVLFVVALTCYCSTSQKRGHLNYKTESVVDFPCIWAVCVFITEWILIRFGVMARDDSSVTGDFCYGDN